MLIQRRVRATCVAMRDAYLMPRDDTIRPRLMPAFMPLPYVFTMLSATLTYDMLRYAMMLLMPLIA